MNPIRKRRLILIILLLIGVSLAVSLTLYALKQNINLFYTPTQVAAHEAPTFRTFRVGGLVQKGSLHHSKTDLNISFVLTDTCHAIKVNYQGILPDLFREGRGIVAQGRLNKDGIFIADQVLAKHDEKYMPPVMAGVLNPKQKS